MNQQQLRKLNEICEDNGFVIKEDRGGGLFYIEAKNEDVDILSYASSVNCLTIQFTNPLSRRMDSEDLNKIVDLIKKILNEKD